MWAPRLPSVAPVSFFSFENSSPVPAGSAFSAAMIRNLRGWWMMSSSSAMALAPAHPQAAEHQPAAIDERHPEVEPVADPEIAHQRERADGKADRDKGMSNPEPSDDVEQHEIDRPERAHLTRRELAEHAGAEETEGEE